MKQVYKDLQELLGSSPAVELTELEKAKELSAGLFAMFEEPLSAEGKTPAGDKRIKVFIAAIRDGSKEAAAARVLRTAIPDVKIYTIGDAADLTAPGSTAFDGATFPDKAGKIPFICDGLLQTDPESSLFAKKAMEKYEQIPLGKDAGTVLSAAIDLAKKKGFMDKPILVYLPDAQN